MYKDKIEYCKYYKLLKLINIWLDLILVQNYNIAKLFNVCIDVELK